MNVEEEEPPSPMDVSVENNNDDIESNNNASKDSVTVNMTVFHQILLCFNHHILIILVFITVGLKKKFWYRTVVYNPNFVFRMSK